MKKRLSKEEWLDKALEAINKEGFGRLKIDHLVTSLGVTKGSFYWHFKNRNNFVLELIEYWDAKFTILVIKHIENFEGNGRERLLELMLFITHHQLAQYDFAIQALAQNEPKIFPMVKEVLSRRFAYVASLFSEMGFRGGDLKFRSRVTVMFMSQEQNSLLRESKEEQLKRIQLAHALFTMPKNIMK
jgi:AcrR family transcriptional regulator